MVAAKVAGGHTARCDTLHLPGPAIPAPAGPRMAPASLVMNLSGLRTCDGDHAGPGRLPFSVESLLEAQRGLSAEPAEPWEERPRDPAEPWARFPPAARSSSPRKCPVAQAWAAREPAWPRLEGPGREGRYRS